MDWDDAYANGKYIAQAEEYPPKWEDEAFAYRDLENAIGRARLNIAYGEGERQKLDLFLPAGRPEGVLMFVHGGYWMAFDNKSWSHLARGAVERGWAVAMPSYTLSPGAKISEITEEIRQALHKVGSLVQGPISLTGHSAGGHLVARMLCRDVELADDIAARLHRVVPISPLSDMRPLMNTKMNDVFKMDLAEAEAESPMLEQNPRDAQVTVWVGGDERPSFIDQARWLADAWESAEIHIAPGLHHFDVIDDLAHTNSALIKAIIE
ncbi:alpha/beta hydrolase [Cochlodiniinecator piscidefendens]|uniref:alpha/beta hydrolase n=1 Tax=Cochlodiniinecator piscidefendens TaxID=2715756 RepID=UPI00140CC6B7|nr:alpha/beta hydrolase [Cochlodiniinecator piscidefendens]